MAFLIDKCALLPVVVTVIGWPISAYIGYRFGLKSQRAAREFAAKDAVTKRRREFLNLAIDLVERIVGSDDPEYWVTMFTQNAPTLRAEFAKIAHELTKEERGIIQSAVDGVLAYANMNPADIDADKENLVKAFDKFPRA